MDKQALEVKAEDPYFNFALVPDSDDLSRLCVELAIANCADTADEYLLGTDALPHVTLCQFNAPEHRLSEIWTALNDLSHSSIELNFRNIYVQFGKKEFVGKSWVGLSVKYEESLLSLQKSVFEKLADLEITGRNTPTNYFPHITFARCDASRPTVISAAPADDFWSTAFKFNTTLGTSDEHGRYHQTIFPKIQV